MPRASRKRKIDPNAVYQAWQSVALHEPNITIVRGKRLLGSHPAVQAAPWCFVPDGTSDEEVAHILEDTEKAKQWEPPAHDLRLQAEPQPLDAVRLTKRLRVLVGTDAGTGRPTELVTYPAGTLFSATSTLAERVPDAFEPAGDGKPPSWRRV